METKDQIRELHITNFNYDKIQSLKRNIKWNLNIDEYIDLYTSKCHYCDAAPSKIHFKRNIAIKYNSIDRKNSDKDYSLDNCVPCCSLCNQVKSVKTYDSFLDELKK